MSYKRFNWIKVFVFAVIFVLIGGIGWIAGSVITRYDVIRYEDSVDVFIGKGLESGEVTAQYGDRKTRLNAYNFQAMRDLLTITERQKRLSTPSLKDTISITVTVDEENYFIVYSLNENGDTLLQTCFDGKRRNFIIDGPKYQVFDRMMHYIMPEGVYGTNDLV